MKKEIRTFVAVKINPGNKVVEQVNGFKQAFCNERINWVEPDNFHITLRFLGNTTREQLYRIVDGLEELAEGFNPFDFQIKGAGYFKSKGHPRVLFFKLDKTQKLELLAQRVEHCAVSAGFQEELKPFRPHLTLGRIKYLQNKTKFSQLVDELSEVDYQHVQVTDFILYQSILRPEGPIYKVIRKFELK